jgi:hypothetical protein
MLMLETHARLSKDPYVIQAAQHLPRQSESSTRQRILLPHARHLLTRTAEEESAPPFRAVSSNRSRVLPKPETILCQTSGPAARSLFRLHLLEVESGRAEASFTFLNRGIGNATSLLRSKTRLDEPSIPTSEQFRTLNEVQEPALAHEMVEVADRVATEFLVIKIQPKPDFRKPVIDVESGGFRVPWNDKEQHEHGALGGDAKCDWAFPNRLTGPGCATLVNPGNPNNYIKTQCFAVPTAPPSFFTPIASTPLCSSDPALGTSAVGDPTLGQCLNLRGNSGRNIFDRAGDFEPGFLLV